MSCFLAVVTQLFTHSCWLCVTVCNSTHLLSMFWQSCVCFLVAVQQSDLSLVLLSVCVAVCSSAEWACAQAAGTTPSSEWHSSTKWLLPCQWCCRVIIRYAIARSASNVARAHATCSESCLCSIAISQLLMLLLQCRATHLCATRHAMRRRRDCSSYDACCRQGCK